MQENLTDDTSSHQNIVEDLAFWQHHIDGFSKTSLSRKAYCRHHALSYDRFQYWYHKVKKKKSAKRNELSLIPIKLRKETHKSTASAHPIIATLQLAKGIQVFIHDVNVLSHLITRIN